MSLDRGSNRMPRPDISSTGSGNRSPGPRACAAGTLLDELTPQPQQYPLRRAIIMSQVY